MLSSKYLPDLARVFSPPALRELASDGQIDRLTYILRESGYSSSELEGCSLSKLLARLYKQLIDAHRLEYVYKNAVVNKWLLGRHSLNTCTFLSEFEVAGAKVDAVLLNSTAHALEIKTSLDDVSRLAKQIASYQTLFGHVSVISSPETLASVKETVDSHVGLYILSPSYTLREISPPMPNYEHLNPSQVVASLRKAEYSDVIQTLTGDIPDVPNARYYGRCRDLIGELDPLKVHAEMFRVLKARKPDPHVWKTVNRIPGALKALWLTAELKASEVKDILPRLDQPYRIRMS